FLWKACTAASVSVPKKPVAESLERRPWEMSVCWSATTSLPLMPRTSVRVPEAAGTVVVFTGTWLAVGVVALTGVVVLVGGGAVVFAGVAVFMGAQEAIALLVASLKRPVAERPCAFCQLERAI